YERFECDPEKVGIMRSERNCDNTGDAEEDIALAQRACLDYARLCDPKWTEEQVAVCQRIAEKTCLELNDQSPIPYEEYDADAGFQVTDIEKREAAPDVATISEVAKKEVAEELGIAEPEPAPEPAPAPAPEPAPVEEKGTSATTWVIIIIIIVIILVVLWYFMKGKKKPAKKKKK
ncbi:hypothetical protein KY326_01370, partial [Candidatus Woesearchaeota archaeon]|nr:hypothetical protein [Candidatus Woesearchaeota archaeon]